MPHIHQKYDFVVTALIVSIDKVLLVNHKKLKKWLPIGGHIELDENPEQALWREIFEETGLKKNLIICVSKPARKSSETEFLYPPSFLDVHDITKKHKHIGLVYIVVSQTRTIKRAWREHEEIRWFSKEEIEQKKYGISQSMQFYLKEALQIASKTLTNL